MDISSVKTPALQQTEPAKRAEDAKLMQSEALKAKAQEVQMSEAQARPVVNTQGQTTGRLLNVVA